MAGVCGGNPRIVEQDTGLRDYILLQQHWLKWGPPVYVSVAAYMGIAKGETDNEPAKNAAQHFGEFMRAFNGG